MDAKQTLIDHKGVFLDQGCLFLSTTNKLLTGYVNCEVIYPYDKPVRNLVSQLVAPFLDRVQAYICPATGDIVLLREAVRQTNDHRQTYAVTGAWADKQSDNSYIVERNGFVPAVQGKRVVVLNDRISQGGTTLKVIAEARRLGCDVLGVATLAGVSGATAEFLDVPQVHALCTIDVKAYAYDELPEELRGMPLCVDPPLGHGCEFEEKMGFPWHGDTVELLAA